MLFSNSHTQENAWILNSWEMYPGRHGKPLAGQYQFSAHPYAADTWHFQDAFQGQYKSFRNKKCCEFMMAFGCCPVATFIHSDQGVWAIHWREPTGGAGYDILGYFEYSFQACMANGAELVVQCLSLCLWGLWCVVWKNQSSAKVRWEGKFYLPVLEGLTTAPDDSQCWKSYFLAPI